MFLCLYRYRKPFLQTVFTLGLFYNSWYLFTGSFKTCLLLHMLLLINFLQGRRILIYCLGFFFFRLLEEAFLLPVGLFFPTFLSIVILFFFLTEFGWFNLDKNYAMFF